MVEVSISFCFNSSWLKYQYTNSFSSLCCKLMVTWIRSISKIFSGSMSSPNGNLKEVLCFLLIATSAEAYENICHKYQISWLQNYLFNMVWSEQKVDYSPIIWNYSLQQCPLKLTYIVATVRICCLRWQDLAWNQHNFNLYHKISVMYTYWINNSGG